MTIEHKLAILLEAWCRDTGDRSSDVQARLRAADRMEDTPFGQLVLDAHMAGAVTDAPWDLVADWLWCVNACAKG